MGAAGVKRVCKGIEPETLKAFRSAMPTSSWDGMRDDTKWNGKQAYLDCREHTISDQGGLCAYCEIGIHENDPLKCRVEHFHPKSSTTHGHNWALDWNNMLAVCSGGSQGASVDPAHYLAPLPNNLSCDAHKDRQIQLGKLDANCAGLILSPLQISAFPILFIVSAFDGTIAPNYNDLSKMPPPPGSKHSTVAALVEHTIDMLNLNCDRLKRARLVVVRNIENGKKEQRSKGFNAEQGMTNLAKRYFVRTWPAFFTTIRSRLGPAAEVHLKQKFFQC